MDICCICCLASSTPSRDNKKTDFVGFLFWWGVSYLLTTLNPDGSCEEDSVPGSGDESCDLGHTNQSALSSWLQRLVQDKHVTKSSQSESRGPILRPMLEFGGKHAEMIKPQYHGSSYLGSANKANT